MEALMETPSGALRGLSQPGVASFRGIPFAAPPVGPLRFREPQPADAWTGVRDATRFGAAPPQLATPLLERLGLETSGPFDEDCLTLNVWTPAPDDRRRPVLVWIHGGAYMNGGGSAALFDGARLAARGDVVVVTLNYRVGALGFLYLDGLDAPGAPRGCNLGLLDQIAALRWVRDHIDAFGGDSANVTVFGESAGAGSICALLAMPRARGLFGRAIVQSAAPDGVLDPDDAAWRCRRLLKVLDVDAARLADLPADELVRAQQRCAAERTYKTGMFFAPVVDGTLLPEPPSRAVAKGTARDVELVIGTTRDELQLYKLDVAPAAMSDEVLAAALGAQIPGTGADGRSHAEVLAEGYRRARGARGESTDPMDLIFAVQTDLAMRMPSIRLAEQHARVQPRTYMYLFRWASPLQAGTLGACHALDVPFTLGNLDAPKVGEFAGAGPRAQALADAMGDAWVAFARTGNPSHPGIGAWPAYDEQQRDTMVFDAESGAQAAPLDEERRLWERLDT